MVWGKKKKGYSYFGGNVTLEGRLCFDGEVRLDGRVNGEIVAPGLLIIERPAIVAGEVLVENLILSGTVYGNIKVYGHVQLSAAARVFGHISYGELSMEGALHEGSSHKFTPDEIEAAKLRCESIMAESTARVEKGEPDAPALARFTASVADAAEKQTFALLSGQGEQTASVPRRDNAPPQFSGGLDVSAGNGLDSPITAKKSGLKPAVKKTAAKAANGNSNGGDRPADKEKRRLKIKKAAPAAAESGGSSDSDQAAG